MSYDALTVDDRAVETSCGSIEASKTIKCPMELVGLGKQIISSGGLSWGQNGPNDPG